MGLVYYGVALAADDLGGEIYRDYILASLLEFPASFLAIYLCNRWVCMFTLLFLMQFYAARSSYFVPKSSYSMMIYQPSSCCIISR